MIQSPKWFQCPKLFGIPPFYIELSSSNHGPPTETHFQHILVYWKCANKQGQRLVTLHYADAEFGTQVPKQTRADLHTIIPRWALLNVWQNPLCCNRNWMHFTTKGWRHIRRCIPEWSPHAWKRCPFWKQWEAWISACFLAVYITPLFYEPAHANRLFLGIQNLI